MIRILFAAILLMSAATVSLAASTAGAGAQEKTPAAKVARLLEESGYTYAKAQDNIWVIAFKGKALSDFNVIVTTEQDVVVLFVIVAEKKNTRVTADLMQMLLKLNGDFDRVKIGFDKDGDTFVRIDLGARVLDAQEFKVNVEQVAASADEVFSAIKPFLTAAKKPAS
jgi:hypothetical protein